MKKQYATEREGQLEFFENFHIDYQNNEVLIDNTDGIWNGNILEFKLNIDNLNKVLYQAVKYLSRMRIRGESVPANILLVSLNSTTMYVYQSRDYFDEIHTIYTGAASKDNEGFVAKPYVAKFDYSDMVDAVEVQKILRQQEYLPIRLDEDCIVGWAERYYRENPTATKGDFIGDETGKVRVIGEIREPKNFKGLILPYEGKTNEKFMYLMDKLNARLVKKDLGAFYTPIAYCKKAAELVRMAIARVPAGNDYIILDRCAGTGNLESVLSDEELSHCILSTYEYYEYKVLAERLGDKVRALIPPTEANVEYANGCVKNADAMSKEYIDNEIIQGYLQNPNCTIILYENPPYRDSSAANKTKDTNSRTTQTYVVEEMSKVKKTFDNSNISTVRDLTNQFVWSGFTYYLRENTDSYILLSPCKWWKSCGIAKYKFVSGYLFNRKYFHASESPITCCLWVNELDTKADKIQLVSIADPKKLEETEKITIRRCFKTLSEYYQKNVDGQKTDVFCESSGVETTGRKCDGQSVYSEEIVGYVTPKGFTLDANNNNLVRMTHYNNRGTYITKENYLKMCPLFVAKEYPRDEYYEKGESCIYFTTSDGGDAYTKDEEFLKRCLIYTCLSNQNKCLSFKGSDGRDYQNELCFDANALALKKLGELTLDMADQELLALWNKILAEAKQTANYDPCWNYGVYQITKELNTYDEVSVGRNTKKVYHYPELNGDLNSLRSKLKDYYKEYITPLMFKYELIK